jgi:hydroxymethylbilane synthase
MSLGSAAPPACTLGTRGSRLARAQTAIVLGQLSLLHPETKFTEQLITTTGDVRQDVPLSQIGGQGVFVAELERALLDGRIDIAIHSAKDLPSILTPGLSIAAYLEREDARDAIVSRSGALADLPREARVGTSSPRRTCQLRSLRPDLDLTDLRGNVDTRLAKLDDGQYDAIVLATAGLVRIGMSHRITEHVPVDVMIPMVAQGAIALQVRSDDAAAATVARSLNHAATATAVAAERAFLATLGAGCSAPLAAHATVDG